MNLTQLYQQLIIKLTQLRDTIFLMETESVPPVVSTPSAPEQVAAPSPTMLDKTCLAIRDYEGVPGDANYLNNNPGNCRYNPDGYLAKYEPVTKSAAGFAIFPSYQIGWEYLENMIAQRIENHPNWTLLQFFEGVPDASGTLQDGYAPTSDGNNPALYAAFVGKRLAVDYQTYLIKNILA
jgi:hypothetical protein